MINDRVSVQRRTCNDIGLSSVIRDAINDNLLRIPFTREGGYISTEFSEDGSDDTIHLSLCGFIDDSGAMMQTITVIYFDTIEKVRRFLSSPEGNGFDDPYGEGQDLFEYTTYAGNPDVAARVIAILKNHFDFNETSRLVADTVPEVHYFRKNPEDYRKEKLKN